VLGWRRLHLLELKLYAGTPQATNSGLSEATTGGGLIPHACLAQAQRLAGNLRDELYRCADEGRQIGNSRAPLPKKTIPA
jgi:hypothetical protein